MSDATVRNIAAKSFRAVMILATVLLLFPAPGKPLFAEEIGWKKVAKDLEIADLYVNTDSLFSSHISLVRTTLSDFRATVIRAADYGLKGSSARTLCKLSKSTVCVNANFFDESGKPLGLVVSRGIIHNKIHKGGKLLNGILKVSRQTVRILPRENFEFVSVLEAVQSGPVLIRDGKKLTDIPEAQSQSRRAGVCIDKDGHFVIFCTSSNIGGISIGQLQNILLSEGFNCTDALNFDGGGSAQLFVNTISGSEEPEIDLPGRDTVPVVLSLLRN